MRGTVAKILRKEARKLWEQARYMNTKLRLRTVVKEVKRRYMAGAL